MNHRFDQLAQQSEQTVEWMDEETMRAIYEGRWQAAARLAQYADCLRFATNLYKDAVAKEILRDMK